MKVWSALIGLVTNAVNEMTDWNRGGWTGSLNSWVRREIREHFRENASAKRARYPRSIRLLHSIFDNGTFGRCVAVYLGLALLVGLAELVLTAYLPCWLPKWTGNTDVESLLANAPSFLITAQVGVLGVVSIAVGLVTIIGQRDNASTDVQVYYHESLAFGVVASSIALLAVLCAQLLWPIQSTLHWLGLGTELLFFKLILTTAHVTWLLLNLCGMAHFIATTLAFVQQTAREQLRERYTANVVLPVEMKKRLREQLYLGAGPEFVQEFWSEDNSGRSNPTIWLGTDFSGTGHVEIPLVSSRLVLKDVRVAWVRWAVGRWLGRCRASIPEHTQIRFGELNKEPLLFFPPRLDNTADVRAGLCRRSGGLPLSRSERLALRWAFKFRSKRNAN